MQDQDLPEQEAPPVEEVFSKKGDAKKKEKAPREFSPAFQESIKEIENFPTAEEKIHRALEFMRAALAQAGNPRFKDFWDMRHRCLSLFKENLSPSSRAHLWSSYVELSTEARRLKEILDEQSSFASEQIELAIKALEKDLEGYDQLVLQMKPVDVLASSSSIKRKKELYEKLQSELNLLNTLAARINGLRKEIIKTEMRMRAKAKFFDKLSAAGDRIFPRRKELIKQISLQFLQDIKEFVEKEFSREIGKGGQPLYVVREEIKVLQSIAKALTLNTSAFKETRELLSSCWDKLREGEKKKKEEISQKRQVSKQNADLVREKIAILSANVQKEEATLDAAESEAKEIQDFMRTLDLDRDSVHALKAEIKKVLLPLVEKAKSVEEERLEMQRKAEAEKKEKTLSILHRAEELLVQAGAMELASISESKETLEREFHEVAASKSEKLRFDKILRKLLDLIVDKKEKAILSLPLESQQAIVQLKEFLKERLHAREEIKKNLEACRKAQGASGLDFEKAMMYREMIDADKERLAKINDSIEEIEEKIADLEG